MRAMGSIAAAAAAFALAACEQPLGGGPTAQNQAPAAGQTAQTASTAPSAVAPGPQAPGSVFKITRVTPTISDDADLGWFAGSEGSPREVGAFIGASVIEGLEPVFKGQRPAALEVNIRQFRPAVALERGSNDAIHRVKLDFILRDEATGEVLGGAENLFMDLVALVGSAGIIARNAGRTPDVRLAERIANITEAWARDASCADLGCPAPIAVAEAPQPAPEPAPAPVAEEVEAPAEARTAAEEPATEVEVAAAPEPASAPEPATTPEPEAAPEEDAPNLFEAIAAALSGDAEEADATPTDEAPAETETEVAAVEPTPEPEPAATSEPVEAEVAPESETPSGEGNLFTLLFGPSATEPAAEDEAPAGAEAPEVETAAAPEPAPEPTPVFEPAPSPEPVETETVVAAVEPEPIPETAPEPAPAETVASQATAPATPQEQTASAGSPFFRSPASTVPTLPQQSLLGRSQRQNDPLRRRTGDVVLEVSNLPAYWDGDQTTGGVWVALPYVPAYRRAVVTNPVNGRTVEANLFWRDPQSGGGSTLLSSAAAEALGVQPGQVANLGVKIVAAD